MKTRNLGEITFGHVKPDGSWKLGSYMGDERIALLTKARNQEPLPDGVVLVVQTDGGYRRAEFSDIDWEHFDWYASRRK
jgi:hypothetical protein